MLEHVYDLGFFTIFAIMAYFNILPKLKNYITRYVKEQDKLVASKNDELNSALSKLDLIKESHSKFVTLYQNIDQRLLEFKNSNFEKIITKQNRDIEALKLLEMNRINYNAKLIKKKELLDLFNSIADKLKVELSNKPLPITEICTKISEWNQI